MLTDGQTGTPAPAGLAAGGPAAGFSMGSPDSMLTGAGAAADGSSATDAGPHAGGPHGPGTGIGSASGLGLHGVGSASSTRWWRARDGGVTVASWSTVSGAAAALVRASACWQASAGAAHARGKVISRLRNRLQLEG